jgi:hypothetical protein
MRYLKALSLVLVAGCAAGAALAVSPDAADAPAAGQCAPAPELAIDPGDADWPSSFRAAGAAITGLQENFAEAYARACREKLIGAEGLVDQAGQGVGRIIRAARRLPILPGM